MLLLPLKKDHPNWETILCWISKQSLMRGTTVQVTNRVKAGSQYFGLQHDVIGSPYKMFRCASQCITLLFFFYSCIASIHLHALPVASHCRQKYKNIVNQTLHKNVRNMYFYGLIFCLFIFCPHNYNAIMVHIMTMVQWESQVSQKKLISLLLLMSQKWLVGCWKSYACDTGVEKSVLFQCHLYTCGETLVPTSYCIL